MKEVIENTVWIKTQSLIHNKFGKSIEFKILGLNPTHQEYYNKGNDLFIPLNSYSSFIGEVKVVNGKELDLEQTLEIVDLIRFLVEPHVYNKHLKAREEIQSFEPQMKSNDQFSNNVVSIHSSNTGLESESLDQELKLISKVIHLRSHQEQTIRNVALKIHEMSGFQFFIGFNEISSQIKTLSDLKDLDLATLFIKNISDLSLEQLTLFEEVVQDDSIRLTLIFASQMTDFELESKPLPEQLKNKLKSILFDIDRVPLSQQTNSDILELLFFNVDNTLGS